MGIMEPFSKKMVDRLKGKSEGHFGLAGFLFFLFFSTVVFQYTEFAKSVPTITDNIYDLAHRITTVITIFSSISDISYQIEYDL